MLWRYGGERREAAGQGLAGQVIIMGKHGVVRHFYCFHAPATMPANPTMIWGDASVRGAPAGGLRDCRGGVNQADEGRCIGVRSKACRVDSCCYYVRIFEMLRKGPSDDCYS
jgi:hypothetical protein